MYYIKCNHLKLYARVGMLSFFYKGTTLSFEMAVYKMDPTWQHPFSCIVSGPSGCGKTQFTLRFIDHLEHMVRPTIDKVLWCYGIYQEIFDKYSKVHFHEGLPDLNVFDGKDKTLLILDDLMSETDERVTKIFTKLSHHRNVSVLYLTQNLFYKGKHTRTISLNAHYMVLFKNVRDTTQIANLARQMFPGQSNFMMEAFRDATLVPFGYLLIDFKPDTDERCRLRTNIFPGETQYVYIRK